MKRRKTNRMTEGITHCRTIKGNQSYRMSNNRKSGLLSVVEERQQTIRENAEGPKTPIKKAPFGSVKKLNPVALTH